MGAQLLKDALKRLCDEVGWSYAVFWRAVGGRNPTHFVWEDGYCQPTRGISGFEAMDLLLKEQGLVRNCSDGNFMEAGFQTEDRVGLLVHKVMMQQVNVLGDGIVGQAAAIGDHQWILRDSFSSYGSFPNVLTELNIQFVSGIQTIAAIPVLPYGVAQLGSTQMVMEDIGFVNHVRCLFANLGHTGSLFVNFDHRAPGKDVHIPAMPVIDSHMGAVGMPFDGLASAISEKHSGSFVQSSLLTSGYQPSFSNLHENWQLSAREMHSIKERVVYASASQQMQPMSDSVAGACLINNQLESASVEFSAVSPDPSLRQVVQPLPFYSGSESKSQSSTVVYSLKDEFPAVHGFILQQPANNSKSMPHIGNSVQNISSSPVHHGSVKSFTLKPLSVGSESVSNNIIGTGSSNNLPGTGVEILYNLHLSLSARKSMENTLVQENLLKEGEMVSEDSRMSNRSVGDGSSKSVRKIRKQEETELFPAYNDPSRKLVADGSCYEQRIATLSLSNSISKEAAPFQIQHMPQNDLFDVVGLDFRKNDLSKTSDMFKTNDDSKDHIDGAGVSSCISHHLDVGPVFDPSEYDISCSGVLEKHNQEQLLDAVVSNITSSMKQSPEDSMSCRTSLTKKGGPLISPTSHSYSSLVSGQQKQAELCTLPPMLLKADMSSSASKSEECSRKYGTYKSQISLGVEFGQNLKSSSMSAVQVKRAEESGKMTRKRARPGENPRPRPKDRQMIQDRVKELREIVPNGIKCSIDALLEKTIKHMLFLQSVTKHADKLKDTGEPKIISKDGGILLKDNFEGGVTRAFEVGTQSMTCPIIVEDLNPPRQMLVEMICEERGFFLEIANLIRGMGLTILKGVMEVRKDKIWARFAVEANRDVTRMEIFLSLVRLLQPTTASGIAPESMGNIKLPAENMQHQSPIPVTGTSEHLV